MPVSFQEESKTPVKAKIELPRKKPNGVLPDEGAVASARHKEKWYYKGMMQQEAVSSGYVVDASWMDMWVKFVLNE